MRNYDEAKATVDFLNLRDDGVLRYAVEVCVGVCVIMVYEAATGRRLGPL